MEELKPCSFCGSTELLKDEEGEAWSDLTEK